MRKPYARSNSRSDSRNWLDAKISAQIHGAFCFKIGVVPARQNRATKAKKDCSETFVLQTSPLAFQERKQERQKNKPMRKKRREAEGRKRKRRNERKKIRRIFGKQIKSFLFLGGFSFARPLHPKTRKQGVFVLFLLVCLLV